MNEKSLRRKFDRFEWGILSGSGELVRIRQTHSLDEDFRGIESEKDSPLLDMAWVERVGDFDSRTTQHIAHLLLTGEPQGIENIQGSLRRGLKGLVLRINGRIVGDITLSRLEAHRFVRYLKVLAEKGKS